MCFVAARSHSQSSIGNDQGKATTNIFGIFDTYVHTNVRTKETSIWQLSNQRDTCCLLVDFVVVSVWGCLFGCCITFDLFLLVLNFVGFAVNSPDFIVCACTLNSEYFSDVLFAC